MLFLVNIFLIVLYNSKLVIIVDIIVATQIMIVQFMQLSIPNSRAEQSSGEWRNRHQEEVWVSVLDFFVCF